VVNAIQDPASIGYGVSPMRQAFEPSRSAGESTRSGTAFLKRSESTSATQSFFYTIGEPAGEDAFIDWA
jgi:hypothetical protein